MELCIVLIREKVQRSVPTPAIECENSGYTQMTSVSSPSGDGNRNGDGDEDGDGDGGTKTKKRKKNPPQHYTFPAKGISLSLFASIEKQVKRNSSVTGVPSGKIVSELSYDLSPYIIGGKDVSDSDDSLDSMVTNTISDEEFISKFTLSKFRKDLMMMAVQSFPEEYGLDKKSIGLKCKLFIKKQ